MQQKVNIITFCGTWSSIKCSGYIVLQSLKCQLGLTSLWGIEASKKCLCFVNHLGTNKFLIDPLQWDLDD